MQQVAAQALIHMLIAPPPVEEAFDGTATVVSRAGLARALLGNNDEHCDIMNMISD